MGDWSGVDGRGSVGSSLRTEVSPPFRKKALLEAEIQFWKQRPVQ